MQLDVMIKSTDYIDFINCLDDLINELLYSRESGYINKPSKEALKAAQSVVDKFNFESDKISKHYTVTDSVGIISQKRDELIKEIKKHYFAQSKKWAYDVFSKNLENNLLKLSVYKNDKNDTKRIYDNLSCLVGWFSSLNNLSSIQTKALFAEIDKKFQNTLKTKDSDYIYRQNPLKSDFESFFKLVNLILVDVNAFLSFDLTQLQTRLSIKDIYYFNKLKGRIKANESEVVDEINLINYALKQLNLKSLSDKYSFVSQIRDDLSLTKIDDEVQKVEVIKRRMKIFKNKEEYYMNLFSF